MHISQVIKHDIRVFILTKNATQTSIKVQNSNGKVATS